MQKKHSYIYILTNKRNGTIYAGVTSNLEKRTYEHKNNLIDGFTKKYSTHNLVYFEEDSDIKMAIEREKQIKSWSRKKKLLLLEKINPTWRDLSEEI